MGLTTALGTRAGIEIRNVGGLELVAFSDAQAFLDACVIAGVTIIGIEGFYIDDTRTSPDMDAIADFSQIRNCEESIFESRAFIKTVGQPEMFFDFTFSENV